MLASGKDGVEDVGNYRVDVEKLLLEKIKTGVNYTQVWRTIVSGYPYKTPEELGVTTKEDAYFVTQQAVYCVMSKRSITTYRGTTPRGENIVKAIERLRQIGTSGWQNPEEVGMNIQKIGGFQEEGKYYYQTYTVTADIDVSYYEVEVEGEDKGEIFVADDSGNPKTFFMVGSKFRIMVPESQINRKTDLKIRIDAKCKTYPVFYGETTKKGTQDYALTYDVFGDFSKKADLTVNLNTGEIQIKRLNNITNEPIEGETFELLNEKGEVITITVTDKNGIAFFENLYPGNYQVKEASIEGKNILNPEKLDIVVEHDKIVVKTITSQYETVSEVPDPSEKEEEKKPEEPEPPKKEEEPKEEPTLPKEEETKPEKPTPPKKEEIKPEEPTSPKEEEIKPEEPNLPKEEQTKPEKPTSPEEEKKPSEGTTTPEKEEKPSTQKNEEKVSVTKKTQTTSTAKKEVKKLPKTGF